MSSKTDNDEREWTEKDFARSKPAGELPQEMAAMFRNKGGRPRGSNKEAISLRLDRDVIEKFKATGRGWQSRINEALRRARV